MTENKTESMGKVWANRIKVLLISGILASIANMIYEWRTHAATIHMPWEVFPALLYMFIIVVVSCLIHDLIARLFPKLKVPVILYVALITTILSFPFTGWFATTMATEFAKIGLLPLCTPILAYAGISAGKDLDTCDRLHGDPRLHRHLYRLRHHRRDRAASDARDLILLSD